jgi:hypothetical protein
MNATDSASGRPDHGVFRHSPLAAPVAANYQLFPGDRVFVSEKPKPAKK